MKKVKCLVSPSARVVRTIGAAVLVCSACAVTGCVFCDAAGTLLVRGRVIDADTLEPLPDVAMGGRAFTDVAETDFSPALTASGDRNNRAPDADGTFGVFFWTGLMPCRQPRPEFPHPDRLEIIVVREGCRETFSIEVDDETAEYILDTDPLYE